MTERNYKLWMEFWSVLSEHIYHSEIKLKLQQFHSNKGIKGFKGFGSFGKAAK